MVIQLCYNVAVAVAAIFILFCICFDFGNEKTSFASNRWRSKPIFKCWVRTLMPWPKPMIKYTYLHQFVLAYAKSLGDGRISQNSRTFFSRFMQFCKCVPLQVFAFHLAGGVEHMRDNIDTMFAHCDWFICDKTSYTQLRLVIFLRYRYAVWFDFTTYTHTHISVTATEPLVCLQSKNKKASLDYHSNFFNV